MPTHDQVPTVEEFVAAVEAQLGEPLQGFYAQLVPALWRAIVFQQQAAREA